MTDKEQKAKEFALRWHGDQKYGEGPYEIHLQAVRDVIEEVHSPFRDPRKMDALLCAAWLHDVLEDTDCPLRLLHSEFGDDVAWLVYNVSGFGKNRKERNKCIYDKIDDVMSANLKCADRIANMRASKGTSLEQMYLNEWREFHDHVAVHADEEFLAELINLHEAEQ